jgi:hypothetical protein
MVKWRNSPTEAPVWHLFTIYGVEALHVPGSRHWTSFPLVYVMTLSVTPVKPRTCCIWKALVGTGHGSFEGVSWDFIRAAKQGYKEPLWGLPISGSRFKNWDLPNTKPLPYPLNCDVSESRGCYNLVSITGAVLSLYMYSLLVWTEKCRAVGN